MLRRFLLFMLVVLGLGSAARATKVYADLSASTAVGNATWDATEKTFAWTASTYAYMVLPGLAGDLTEYTQLVLDVKEMTAPFRVDFQFGGGDVWETAVAYYNLTTGLKTIDLSEKFTEEQLAQVTAVRLNTNSESGSLSLNAIYLVKPFKLEFDETGKAYIYPSDLAEGATGFTMDEQTGLITKSEVGNAGITFELGDVDFSGVVNISLNVDVTSEGYMDLIWRTIICNQTEDVGAWYSSKYNITYTSENQAKSEHVREIRIEANSESTGSMKLNYICITKDVLAASDIKKVLAEDFKNWTAPEGGTPTGNLTYPAYNIGTIQSAGGTIYGDGNVYYLNYADLTGCSYLKLVGTPGLALRVLMNRITDGGANVEVNPVIGNDGTVIVDLSTYDYVHLNAIKLGWGSASGVIDEIGVHVDGIDYVLSGSGELNASAQAALVDTKAMVMDATGLTNTEAMELSSANPNCLFLVSDASKLSNEKNVLVKGEDGTYACANLALESGYSFRTPYSFTVEAASVKKTVGPNFGTFVSPFEVAVPDGCKAYNLTGVDENNVVTGEETATVAANKPVLLAGDGECTFEAEDVTVEATPASLVNGILNGVYEAGTTAPEGSYVLQTQDDVTAFYKVAEGGKQRVTPFTAYLALPTAAAVNAKSLSVSFDNAGTTRVDDAAAEGPATVEAVYDLQGRKLDAPTKGVNLLRLSDGSVKKVIVK